MVGFGILFIVVLLGFLIEKKPWRGYESFADWEAQMVKKLKGSGDWVRKQLQNLKELVLALWAKRPPLKPLYIVLATFIGFVILYLFVIICLKIYFIGWETIAIDDSKTRNYAIAFIGLVSGFGALFGVYLAIQRTDESKRQSKAAEREATTAEQGLITDRLNKATEGLGKKDGVFPVIEVRLGALYALERIAQDSIRDHVPVMEILCAYVRQNSPITNKMDEPALLRADIQTALTIIGRRLKGKKGAERLEEEILQNYYIDLSRCNLHFAALEDADLSGAHLYRTKLTDAMLMDAKLEDVTFSRTNLTGSAFDRAKLTNARFSDTITNDVFAREGDISDCLELTQEQLDVMYCGIDVKIPDGLTRPTHWPIKNLSLFEFRDAYSAWLNHNIPH